MFHRAHVAFRSRRSTVVEEQAPRETWLRYLVRRMQALWVREQFGGVAGVHTCLTGYCVVSVVFVVYVNEKLSRSIARIVEIYVWAKCGELVLAYLARHSRSGESSFWRVIVLTTMNAAWAMGAGCDSVPSWFRRCGRINQAFW